MASVNGKDVILQLSADAGVTYKTMVCETENGFEGSTDTTSTATKCSGGVTDIAPGATTWSMNGSGVIKLSPGSTEVSYADLLGWWSGTTLLKAKIDDTGAGFKHVGDVYITKLSLKNPVNGFSAFDATFSGTGALTIS